MAVAPAFCSVKVMPSALVFKTNVKSLAKDCTLIGVVQKALPTSLVTTPSLSCRAVPFNVAEPLSSIPVWAKPEAKLMALVRRFGR